MYARRVALYRTIVNEVKVNIYVKRMNYAKAKLRFLAQESNAIHENIQRRRRIPSVSHFQTRIELDGRACVHTVLFRQIINILKMYVYCNWTQERVKTLSTSRMHPVDS